VDAGAGSWEGRIPDCLYPSSFRPFIPRVRTPWSQNRFWLKGFYLEKKGRDHFLLLLGKNTKFVIFWKEMPLTGYVLVC
jgi:hypothetical protein